MIPRRAILPTALLAACALPEAAPRPRPALSADGLLVAADAWHSELCLAAPVVRAGPLASCARDAPAAKAFAFGFALESWMRAAQPGLAEAFEALGGGPGVIVVRALPDLVPAGTAAAVPLRLPAGGQGAIAAFVMAQLAAPLPPAPPGGAFLLVPAARRYSLDFTCNTWVMAALAAAGLPVPVQGIRLQVDVMDALRAEAARQQ